MDDKRIPEARAALEKAFHEAYAGEATKHPAIFVTQSMELADALVLAVHDRAALVPKWYENDRTREQLDELASMREHLLAEEA